MQSFFVRADLTAQIETLHGGAWDCFGLLDDLRPSQLQSQECDLHLKCRGYFWVREEWTYLIFSSSLPKLLQNSATSISLVKQTKTFSSSTLTY